MASPRTLLAIAHMPWVALAIAACVKTWIAPAQHTVFPKFIGGAQQWWSRQSLFDDDQKLGAFRYSPTFAVLMTPFQWMGPRIGGMAWVLTSILTFLVALHAWIGAMQLDTAYRHARGAMVLVTWLPAIRGVWNAQSNILVAAMFLFATASVATDKWRRAAACLTVAIVLKLTPLAVAMLLAAVWPRRMAWPLLLALVIGAAIPFLCAPTEYVLAQYGEWGRHLTETQSARWPSFRDAWTVWELVHSPIHVPVYRVVQLSAAMVVLWWCVRRATGPVVVRASLVVSAGIDWMLLFGPAVEYNTYILLGPFVAWAMVASAGRPVQLALAVVAYLLIALAGAGAVERQMLPLIAGWPAVLPLGTLLFGVWQIRHNRLSQISLRSNLKPMT